MLQPSKIDIFASFFVFPTTGVIFDSKDCLFRSRKQKYSETRQNVKTEHRNGRNYRPTDLGTNLLSARVHEKSLLRVGNQVAQWVTVNMAIVDARELHNLLEFFPRVKHTIDVQCLLQFFKTGIITTGHRLGRVVRHVKAILALHQRNVTRDRLAAIDIGPNGPAQQIRLKYGLSGGKCAVPRSP